MATPEDLLKQPHYLWELAVLIAAYYMFEIRSRLTKLKHIILNAIVLNFTNNRGGVTILVVEKPAAVTIRNQCHQVV